MGIIICVFHSDNLLLSGTQNFTFC